MATRDYKTREKTRPRHGRRGGSGFFWFVTGTVFGAFGVGLAWMLQDKMPPRALPGPQAQTEAPAKPSFIFHQLLPEMEVLVPDEELSAAAALPPKPKERPAQQKQSPKAAKPQPQQTAAAQEPEKPTADGASYLVQVASFRKASDAERLKAKLALLGVQARIQQVTVNGKDYHRVRTGPYKGKQAVNKTRALLSSNGMETMTIKLK
ncbi:MAG: SPOR domain-containing protein [Chromatiaceae bacterium]|nr:SPOR domain-containing protein [Chromatiaceae bacterium]